MGIERWTLLLVSWQYKLTIYWGFTWTDVLLIEWSMKNEDVQTYRHSTHCFFVCKLWEQLADFFLKLGTGIELGVMVTKGTDVSKYIVNINSQNLCSSSQYHIMVKTRKLLITVFNIPNLSASKTFGQGNTTLLPALELNEL